MLKRNIIKTTVLCLALTALLTASAIAQTEKHTPKLMERASAPGIEIRVKQKSGGKVVATTTTDRDGNFSFSLSSGDYILQVGPAAGDDAKANSAGRDAASGQATGKRAIEKKWINLDGSRYQLHLDGEGVVVGEASLREDKTTDAKLVSVGKTKYNEKTNVSSRVNSAISELSFAIKDKGVQRGAVIKVSGTVAYAN